MKKIFYAGVGAIVLFEAAHVYFIMPMPGSQRMNSLELAYFLHQWRWLFRIAFWGMIAAGLLPAWRTSRRQAFTALGALALAAAVTCVFNAVMAADTMFYQPRSLRMADSTENKVKTDKLVLGIEYGGQAKAYPIQYLGYHHQVQDTVGGKPVIVTYCTVCRTGRVYEPLVRGKYERFRLVGMDHFNAMFEDATTGSWWRQVTGEAVAGPLSGSRLPEIPALQTSLATWLELWPNSLIMQADSVFSEEYAGLDTYDKGLGRGKLTGTDTLSWNHKSWVVGIDLGEAAKAYDWNRLKQERIIHDKIGSQAVVLVLAADNQSFFAFERAPDMFFTLKNDTLAQGDVNWNLAGTAMSPGGNNLAMIPAYQEFWHSWRTFHPNTLQ